MISFLNVLYYSNYYIIPSYSPNYNSKFSPKNNEAERKTKMRFDDFKFAELYLKYQLSK